jgi:hypothetical protein
MNLIAKINKMVMPWMRQMKKDYFKEDQQLIFQISTFLNRIINYLCKRDKIELIFKK